VRIPIDLRSDGRTATTGEITSSTLKWNRYIAIECIFEIFHGNGYVVVLTCMRKSL